MIRVFARNLPTREIYNSLTKYFVLNRIDGEVKNETNNDLRKIE